MIEVKSYALQVQTTQQVTVPAGSIPANAHAVPAPRIAFLVDPSIDSNETWDVLLIGEDVPVTGSVSDGWCHLGAVSTFHCFARKVV